MKHDIHNTIATSLKICIIIEVNSTSAHKYYYENTKEHPKLFSSFSLAFFSGSKGFSTFIQVSLGFF